MYPTIQSFDASGSAVFTVPQQQQQQQRQQGAPQGNPFGRPPPAVQQPVSQPANGLGPGALPSASTAAANSGSFTTLRVHIAEPYRTAPPVRAVPTSLPPAKPPTAALQLDYERKVVQDMQSAAAAADSAPQGGARTDPFEVLVKRYMDMGYSREEVGMALAMVGEETDNSDKVVECCKQYQELSSMGFKADIVVGALLLSKGDLNAATDACLMANADL